MSWVHRKHCFRFTLLKLYLLPWEKSQDKALAMAKIFFTSCPVSETSSSKFWLQFWLQNKFTSQNEGEPNQTNTKLLDTRRSNGGDHAFMSMSGKRLSKLIRCILKWFFSSHFGSETRNSRIIFSLYLQCFNYPVKASKENRFAL